MSAALAAIAVFLASQALAVVIWGATLTNSVKNLEAQVAPIQALMTQVSRIQTRQDAMLGSSSVRSGAFRVPRAFAPQQRPEGFRCGAEPPRPVLSPSFD
jgi:hypothetical protein